MTAIMDQVDTRTWSTTQVGAWLGLPGATMHRWWGAVRPERPGSGGRIRLTPIEVLIFYAWLQLGTGTTPMTRPIRQRIADAIRTRPGPYVVLMGPDCACTADSPEEAATPAYARAPHVRTIIGLVPAYDWMERS